MLERNMISQTCEWKETNNNWEIDCFERGFQNKPKRIWYRNWDGPEMHVLSLRQIEDLLDLITALVKFKCIFSTTVVMQCTFQSSPWWFAKYYRHHITWSAQTVLQCTIALSLLLDLWWCYAHKWYEKVTSVTLLMKLLYIYSFLP